MAAVPTVGRLLRCCLGHFSSSTRNLSAAAAALPAVLYEAGHGLGEGPIWTGTQYLHVDILKPALYAHSGVEGAKPRVYSVPTTYASTVVMRKGHNAAVVALEHHLAVVDLDSGACTELARPPADSVPAAHPWRFNEGKCGPDGRLWVGTMVYPPPFAPVGTLYRVDKSLTMTPVLRGVTITNGTAWSLDGKTMYYIDTPTAQVVAFDYDLATGDLSNRRVVITVEDPASNGNPDGSCIDAEGMLWVAQWGGSRVVRYNPHTGAILETLKFPVKQVSACTFGGPDLRDLLVTTAREGMTAEQIALEPLAGSTFIVRNAGKGAGPGFAFDG